MGRIDALKELLGKVEAGDNRGFRLANRAVFSTPAQDVALQMKEENSRHAYNGSLDAAKALHDAVLPDWIVSDFSMWHQDSRIEIWGTHEKNGEKGWHNFHDGRTEAENKIPARAWLIAILKALIAQESP